MNQPTIAEERIAKMLAFWHGQHAFSRSEGETKSVASWRLMVEPTGWSRVYDQYAEKHWKEYLHAARAMMDLR